MAEYGRLTRSSVGKEGRVFVITTDQWMRGNWRCFERTDTERNHPDIQARGPGWYWGLADAYRLRSEFKSASNPSIASPQ